MLELATRADCEKNYDFARLLTQLAIEVFVHARELEENRDRAAVNRFARKSGGYIGFDRDSTIVRRALRFLRETQEDDGSWYGH